MKLKDAAKRGRVDLVQPEIPGSSKEDLTGLLRAVSRDFHSIRKGPDHLELAKVLIDAGAQPDEEMVHQASRSGLLEMTELLAGSNPSASVHIAAALGDLDRIDHLLTSDRSLAARLDGRDRSPLHFCCASALGKRDPVRRDAVRKIGVGLIDAGSPLDSGSNCCGLDLVTPLFHACWTGGDLGLVFELLERGAEPTDRCLWAAVGHFQRHGDGNYDIAEELLQRGTDVNHYDQTGRTMLHAFAAHEDERGVRWLLTHGADPLVRDTEGMTPLHAAARRNTGVRTVRALLQHGADPQIQDATGKTPLDLAISRGRQQIADTLTE